MAKKYKIRAEANRLKLFLFGIVWLVLQGILVFYKTPIGFISDEVLYKRIADSLFHFQPAISWHYPILYPLLISPGLFFNTYFYEAMVMINIIFKGLCLIVIWKLLRRETDNERAFYILILIGFSPIYFLYSRVLFAENLACPLLIINFLYHESFRKKLLSDDISTKKKLGFTVIASLLSLALFWTKYLMLITLPVFCLCWCSVYLREKSAVWIKVKKFMGTAILYTLMVLVCILGYAFCYAVRTGMPLTLETITGTMGFGIGSGPANNGYAITVEAKWLLSYALYALLGAVPIIAGIIVMTGRRCLNNNKAMITLGAILILALVYISARHSTYVDYNAGGKMMNLCGRYVAYATPILAICWLRTYINTAKNKLKIVWGGAIGIILVWVSYILLYVTSPGVEQSASWLTGLRAADNAGFTNLGISLCIIYCICIFIICISNYKSAAVIISILMCVHSFAAIFTCEKYHTRDYMYSAMAKEFFDRYQDDTAIILCTEALDYTYLSGQKLFYQTGDRLDYVSVMTVTDMEQPMYFAGDEQNYFFVVDADLTDKKIYEENKDLYEGSIEQNKLFLKWDSSRFAEGDISADMKLLGDNQVQFSCRGDAGTIFICGTYILPAIIAEGQAVVTVDKNALTEDMIYIFDMGSLTASKIKLEW